MEASGACRGGPTRDGGRRPHQRGRAEVSASGLGVLAPPTTTSTAARKRLGTTAKATSVKRGGGAISLVTTVKVTAHVCGTGLRAGDSGGRRSGTVANNLVATRISTLGTTSGASTGGRATLGATTRLIAVKGRPSGAGNQHLRWGRGRTTVSFSPRYGGVRCIILRLRSHRCARLARWHPKEGRGAPAGSAIGLGVGGNLRVGQLVEP